MLKKHFLVQEKLNILFSDLKKLNYLKNKI
jgi:hypothetical protein